MGMREKERGGLDSDFFFFFFSLANRKDDTVIN